MKRGHVTGTKRERKPRQANIVRYRAMGAAIAAKLEGKITQDLLNWTSK
jgi:hypothetical protein